MSKRKDRVWFDSPKLRPADYRPPAGAKPLNGHTRICSCGRLIGKDYIACGLCESILRVEKTAKKYEDTKIASIEKQYGVDFGVRSDMKLGKYLKQEGFPSLSKALDRAERNTRKK